MTYNKHKAEDYWNKRVEKVDEIRAVLSYGLPEYVNKAYHFWETELMMRSLGDIKGKSVLDVACGVGRLSKILVEAGSSLTCLDNSQAMLDRTINKIKAINKIDQVKMVKASADNMPVPDNCFDAVVCFGLLEHLPTDTRQAALSEIIRVAKDESTILLVIYNRMNLFFENIERYKMQEQQDDGYFVMPMDLSSIRSLLTNQGFVVEEIGNNFLYSFVRQAVERMTDVQIDQSILEKLLKFSVKFDLENNGDRNLAEVMADHFLIKGVRKK